MLLVESAKRIVQEGKWWITDVNRGGLIDSSSLR